MERKRSKAYKIADTLSLRLQGKNFPAGAPVSSVREVASEFRISPVTAHKVMRLLAKHGIVDKVVRKGYFVRSPRKIRIGYLSVIPTPYQDDLCLIASFRVIHHFFDRHGVEFIGISYTELTTKPAYGEMVKSLDGILVSIGFINNETIAFFQNFKGKIVVYRNDYVCTDLRCSQVLPDWSTGIEELMKFIQLERNYDSIFLLSGIHPNSQAKKAEFQKIFACNSPLKMKVKYIDLPATTCSAEMMAYRYFKNNPEEPGKILVISLSSYFCPGVSSYFDEISRKADILICDDIPENGAFRGIDSGYIRTAEEAARLLLRLISENDDKNYLIRIPTHYVERETCPGIHSEMAKENSV